MSVATASSPRAASAQRILSALAFMVGAGFGGPRVRAVEPHSGRDAIAGMADPAPRTIEGVAFDPSVAPAQDGKVTVKLSVAGQKARAGRGPQNVTPNELAGMVVDGQGKPLEGVEVDLIAHDGKFGQWRSWANGVTRPFATEPGERRAIVLKLGRPARVRGRVVDSSGKPVADREVRASAADRLENRYYDPSAKTAADGTFDLNFIRAGEQFIQVAPFWLDASQAPEGTSQVVTLEQGETKSDVVLRAQAQR
jgi:hypothetical protein